MRQNPTVDDLQAALSEMLGKYDRTYLIVDGLNECSENVDEVVAAITSWAEGKGQLSLALLSRNEVNIRGYMRGYRNIEIAAYTEDVALYVMAQIEERIRAKRLWLHDPRLKEEIIQALTEGAAGM